MPKKIAVLLIIILTIFGKMSGAPAAVEGFDVNAGMRQALKDIKADLFREQMGVDGRGIKVAVIDTGIDPSHPDLRKTPGGALKIIDYADFTSEGLVQTRPAASPSEDTVFLQGRRYGTAGIISRSGSFRAGMLKESQLDERGYIDQDLNRDGDNKDIFGVLVSDSSLPGVYDTVYVDTNLNDDFSDEKPLKVYNKGFEWASFGRDNPATEYVEESSFVVSEIDPAGKHVKISFDGNGHGTHVAGIIGANGRLIGTAPGVQIIAVKAVGSSGEGNWEDIARAVEYAGEKGADIINISIGGVASSGQEQLAQSRLFKKISLDRKTLLVIAAGNTGPGLATAAGAADGESVITVGAYMSPPLWKINYNAKVDGDTIWYFSGAGPSINGSLLPHVVAPSSVISTVARWDSGGYFLMDGTSMAAPFVSGSAALLLEKARREGIPVSAGLLKKSLELGARKINGYLEVEQGYGLIDVFKSWDAVKFLKDRPAAQNVVAKLPGAAGYTGGVFFKNRLAGRVEILLTNLSDSTLALKLKSDPSWVKQDKTNILLPRGKPRAVTIYYDIPEKPGIYTARTRGFVGEEGVPVVDFGTTAVVPYDLAQSGSVSLEGSLSPSRWHRYFFSVKPGMSELSFNLTVNKDKADAMGRGLIYIYDPDGRKVFEGYAGADYEAPTVSTHFSKPGPGPGVWEAVVVSDYNLSDFGADKTEYSLTVSAGGAFLDGDCVALSAAKGQKQISREIMLKNGAGSVGGILTAVGLADEGQAFVSKIVSVADGEFAPGPEIKVPAGAVRLDVYLEPVGSFDGDVDLYLYKKVGNGGEYEEVASSAQVDVNHEKIQLVKPPPGEYFVYVDGFSVPGGSAGFRVNYRVLAGTGGIVVEEQVPEGRTGENRKVKLLVSVPGGGNEFTGYLSVKDGRGGESYIPVKLWVGKKTLLVDYLPEGSVTVRERDSKKPVSTSVIVNGMEYPVKNGRVILPRGIKIKTIEIQDYRYGPLYLEFKNL
ncbi:S8 family serine peptidase [Thermoanaerobacterium sp. DL9XJH110]|uniref:S8 family serine peptidase n=1 Tax=Thermoanaerobacterium sp. DL9XJH110 TaxID=3386643 RepID=UPI003BB754CE